jgi:uncharacterized protein
MKVVLDTNILVSGLLQSKGNPAQVLELALAGALLVCHDASIVEEYREVLGRPRFKCDPERVREVLTKFNLMDWPLTLQVRKALDCQIPMMSHFWPSPLLLPQIFCLPEISPLPEEQAERMRCRDTG